MPKVNLSAAFCQDAKCLPDKKRTDYYDQAITGFTLECRMSGCKTYTLRYTDAYGKQRQHKLGSYDELSFAQAQKLARSFKADIIMGGDPAARKAEKRAVPTFADLARQHIEYAKTYQKSWQATEMTLRVHILPRWGKERLDRIAQPAIAAWLAEKRDTGLAPASIERIRSIFHRSFELALQWGTAGVKTNPVRGIPRPKLNNARNRFLSSEEAARLLAACEGSLNPQLKSIAGLLLLTGARKRELLDARWEHVDLEKKSWFIPTSKTGRSRHVPLSQAATAIIESLPRFKGCPWLLPNPRTRKPFSDIKHPWETAREAAGLEGLHIHDLRHSAASFMINAGIDLFAVGRILGHADHQSTMRYSHLADETLLRAVEAGAAGMNVAWADARSGDDGSQPTE